MTGTFDLRFEVADIPTETDTVDFTFNLKLAHEVKQLRGATAPDEDLLANKEAELKAASYTAHLRAVSRGQRQDIYTDSLDKYVAKPDLMGRIDDKTEFLRGNYVRVHVIVAALEKLVNPAGEEQTENLADTVQFIHDKAPDQIFEVIERKVQELNSQQDEQDALHKTADF